MPFGRPSIVVALVPDVHSTEELSVVFRDAPVPGVTFTVSNLI